MELIKEQVNNFENIKTICSNYRKDSASRKTVDYLENRLSKLEKEWVSFQKRHEILEEKIEDKGSVNYFTSDIYVKTKQLYNDTKKNMTEMLVARKQPSETEFDLAGMLGEETDDKLKELLNTQETNFKALARAMSKVNMEVLKEKWEFEDHLNILKSKWEAVDKQHWQLETALKGSSLKRDYGMRFESLEQKYDNLRRLLNSKNWSNIHYQHSAPKIQIPEFSGDYIQWLSFKDIFIETVHNNPTISNCQKMQYLKTKLKGEPERLVQHLTISAENYISCWEILTHRYDNRRLQFTTLMNTMQQVPVIQYPNSYNLKRLHDVISESRNGLSNMGIDVSNWGPIIVHYMSQKLDAVTFNEYTKDLKNNRDLPDISEFLSFLENKFMALETVKTRQRESLNPYKPNLSSTFNRNFQKTYRNIPIKTYNYGNNNQKSTLLEGNREHSKTFHTSFGKCPLCEKNHVLMQCDKFIAKDTVQRNNLVTKLNICRNCLYSHGNASCTSQKTCKVCDSKHHTLLHINEVTSKNNIERKPSTSKQQSTHHLSADIEVLLTTVQIKVQTIDGTYITLRALLDQGSQTNLITEDAAQRLRQPRTRHSALITGIGTTTRDSKGRMSLTCKSIHSDFTFNIETLILNRLTNNLPTQSFKKMNWEHLENLKLADPEYNISSPIDLLLGADVYADIILDGIFKSDSHTPIAQHTKLGWILCGKLKTVNCHVSIVDLSEISKYWESEDILQGPEDINQEDECELLYQQTTRRASDGKFIVKMPLVDNFEVMLGKSRPIAISQFLQLERRFGRNARLSSMYKDFINEYCELQHMKRVPRPISLNKNWSPTCFLPHHGVIREGSSTTKLRVVFNASQKTTSGNSLNSVMKKGPNLQKDMLTIILKWRTYKYAFTADIEKMFRCIWLDETQHNLMRIIWRNSPTEELQEHTLCTVTYGTKTIFADDLTSGHNNLEVAKQLQTEVIALLKGGGMNLRKWSSNTPELLQHLNQNQIAQSTYDFKNEDMKKTLGLGWNPNSDTFTFTWDLEDSNKTITKRFLLSQISQLYDPLGWFSPITITTKLMFQQIWKEKTSWDEPLPEEIQNNWRKLKAELSLLKTIQINRWIKSIESNVELLGFCDASEKAYACVIYLRALNEEGKYNTTLLTAKTRVAPISQKITLPRLELCGALLLAQLIQKVKESLKEHNITVWAWCDSKVVLAWIQGETTKWERYVENRAAKIKQIIPASQWNYIDTKTNPADCATRGVYPSKLLNFELWWKGPTILTTFREKELFNSNCLFTTKIDKRQEMVIRNKADNHNLINNLLNKHSSLTRANRVLTWVMRFITITRRKAVTDIEFDSNNIRSHYLTTKELDTSNRMFIKYAQNCDFEVELNLLSKNKPVHVNNVLYKLNPYLDQDGIMRVGGRLNKTNLPLKMRNPIILSRNGRYTLLLIEQAHIATLHGGPRLTLAYIRQRYWIVGGNKAVKTQLRRCVRCHRFKTHDNFQLMADLPRYRVTPCRPFTHTGVDFTGHVDLKLNKGRGVKTSTGIIKRPVTKLLPLPIREIDINEEKGSPTPPHNVLKKGFLTMIGILLILFSFCGGVEGVSMHNSTHITSLGNRPIYYDNLGEIQLLHDEWKLLLYFNLSTYWEGVQKMEHYLDDTNSFCKRIDPRFCEVTMQQLYHELELLKHYNKLLLSPHKHLSSRYKRGLINGVGYVANSLFGVLDQRFADKYKEDIEALQNNENHLLELIKNQTSVIRLENDILEKSEANVKRQFALINTFMNETEVKLGKIETAIEATMAANYFSSTSLTAYLLLTKLKNMQEMLYSALNDVYQGHIDVHLLTPLNVIKHLNMISGRLPKTLSLPIDNLQQNIKNIYKILYARARITSEYFMLEVHIPLARHEDYSLFEVVPLPLKSTQNKTLAVEVSSKYVAINFEKNTYVSITVEQLTKCNELSSQRWICNLNLPVQHIENDNAPCEIRLLSQRTSSPCNIRNIICEERWIELHTQNTWVALCCDLCTLRTICDKDVITHVINTSSIVTLKQGCLLQTKTFLIHSRNSYNSKAKLDLDFQVPLLNTSVNAIIRTQTPPQLHLFEDRKINIVKEELDHIEKHEQLPTTITATDLHQFTICYLLLAGAVITLLIWLVKKGGYCARRVKVNPTTQIYEDIELQPHQPKTIQDIFRSYSAAERGTTSAVRTGTQAKQSSSRKQNNEDVQFEFE